MSVGLVLPPPSLPLNFLKVNTLTYSKITLSPPSAVQRVVLSSFPK